MSSMRVVQDAMEIFDEELVKITTEREGSMETYQNAAKREYDLLKANHREANHEIVIGYLREYFIKDLLNQFSLIAKWLGHSVRVMLEHYERIQQSDLDQIANAGVQVREKSEPKNYRKRGNFRPFFSENMSLTVENKVPTPKTKASLNASLYTAVEGEFGSNREESPTSTNLQHALKNKIRNKKVVNGKKWYLA